MLRTLLTSLRVTGLTVLLTGLLYPSAVTALAQVLFADKANGSLVKDDRGRVVGSALIGQAFTHAGYFWSRPSAAGAGYDALASGGSNLGPTSKRLRERVTADAARISAQHAGATHIPVDLVSASGSGLDPHISVAAARYQLVRVAAARSVEPARVSTLVDSMVEGRDLGLLGEPRVNVLRLNLALDTQFGAVH
ncbi:MAG: potassium-transporting ATPase subunit KdpC [Deltaproteobacteria bacterium]|nr:potassium-transporting ATPase subunit KdpC [Deltaproteobacteria bacterium]